MKKYIIILVSFFTLSILCSDTAKAFDGKKWWDTINFFCQKYGIEPKQVETYFAFCKRTNKTDKRVEFFRSTSGPKKMKNTLNLLEQAVYNVDHGNHLKNRMSCKYCKFRRTKHCP